MRRANRNASDDAFPLCMKQYAAGSDFMRRARNEQAPLSTGTMKGLDNGIFLSISNWKARRRYALQERGEGLISYSPRRKMIQTEMHRMLHEAISRADQAELLQKSISMGLQLGGPLLGFTQRSQKDRGSAAP